MAATEKRSFTLPTEQAAFIDKLVKSGAYATSSEVIRDGLRALQERDAAIECWLREEVAPTYDEMKAHPERYISGDQVMNELRAHHAARLKENV